MRRPSGAWTWTIPKTLWWEDQVQIRKLLIVHIILQFRLCFISTKVLKDLTFIHLYDSGKSFFRCHLNFIMPYQFIGNLYKWAVQFSHSSSNYDSISAIKFNPSGSKIIATFDGTASFVLVLLDAYSGLLLDSY